MLKKWMFGLLLLSTSLVSQAGVIAYENTITGLDMVGINVTATFGNGTKESFLWEAIGTTLNPGSNSVIQAEGLSGGVAGTGWSLQQQGFTLGNYNDGTIYGAWTFADTSDGANTANSVTSVTIDTGDTGVVFDTVTLNDLSQDNNGSGQGKGLVAFDIADFDVVIDPGVTNYGDLIFNELANALTLDVETMGPEFSFWADTDIQKADDGTSGVVLVVDEILQVNNTEVLNAQIKNSEVQGNSLRAYIDGSGSISQAQAAIDQAAVDGNKVAQAIQENPELVAAIADTPALLEALGDFDITALPAASSDSIIEEFNNQLIELVEDILEQKVKDEWTVIGNGDIDVEIDRVTGDVAIALAVEDEDSNTPLEYFTLLDTPDESFFINFTFDFQTVTGSFDLSLDNILLQSFIAVEGLTNISYLVDKSMLAYASLFDKVGLELRFELFPGSASAVNLSNMSVSFLQANAVPAPATLLLFMSGLLTLLVFRKKAAGK
jgi:hypothetical protein